MEKMLSADDVAEALQVSRRTAYTIMHQMEHLPRPFRVTEGALRGWLAERTLGPGETPGKAPAAARKKRRYAPPAPEAWRIPRRREQAK